MIRFFTPVLIGLCFLLIFVSAQALALEVNEADVTQLDALPGVGQKKAAHIVDERQAHGDYLDWADLLDRTKGLGERSAIKLSQAGLTVNGSAFESVPGSQTAAPRSKSKSSQPESGKACTPKAKQEAADSEPTLKTFRF
jgi:competence protein ComEA